MPDEPKKEDRHSAGAEQTRAPADSGSRKEGSGPRPLMLAVVGLGAVAIAWVALDRTVSRLPAVVHHETPDLATIPLPVPPPPPREQVAEEQAPATAPALSRFAQERAEAAASSTSTRTSRSAGQAPHPMPEQLRAARRIAEERRIERNREEQARVARATTPQPRRLAPSGRVVQLGVYDNAQAARSATNRFRYRYRGLLATLPAAVVPFRPPGARQAVYRVQFVVPNQAYAEITCQRLRAAQKACTVIY
jgi:hypothetical protein